MVAKIMTKFKKGNIPWNKGKKGCWTKEALNKIKAAQKGRTCWKARPIGAERVHRGLIEVKVCNSKNRNIGWRLKHHVIYEKYNPGVKIEHPNKVIFIDGNNRNFDINNLALVTLREQLILKQLGKPTSQEEGRALLNMARLQAEIINKIGEKEYRRQYINQYYKEYRQKHKRQLDIYHNDYWQDHKDEINAKRRIN